MRQVRIGGLLLGAVTMMSCGGASTVLDERPGGDVGTDPDSSEEGSLPATGSEPQQPGAGMPGATSPLEPPAPADVEPGGTDGPATKDPATLPPAELRFSQIAAGLRRYCGLLREDGGLACVADGQLESYQAGPFKAFSLHEAGGYYELCTLTEADQFMCERASDAGPLPAFEGVASGFGDVCATDAGILKCRLPLDADGNAFGLGQEPLVIVHRCSLLDAGGHINCSGTNAIEGISDFHFFSMAIGPEQACGVSFEPDQQGVLCVDASGAQLVGPVAAAVAVNLEGGGCAISDGATYCWGGLEPPAPQLLPFEQLSVSESQACALDSAGAAHCGPLSPIVD